MTSVVMELLPGQALYANTDSCIIRALSPKLIMSQKVEDNICVTVLSFRMISNKLVLMRLCCIHPTEVLMLK